MLKKCVECGNTETRFLLMADYKEKQHCITCDGDMKRDYPTPTAQLKYLPNLEWGLGKSKRQGEW